MKDIYDELQVLENRLWTLEELLWEMKLWQREGKDAKRITDKIWQELEDIIEKI